MRKLALATAVCLLAVPAYATNYSPPPEPEPEPAPIERDAGLSDSQPEGADQCDRHSFVICSANGAGGGVLFQDKNPKRTDYPMGPR